MNALAPIALRPALPADYDTIAEIWHAGASLPTVGPAALPPVAVLRARIDAEFAAGWTVIIALRDGEMVGFAAMKQREAVLDQLFLAPGAVGGGVGRALLDAVKTAMPEGFTLFTRTGNGTARRFYEKAGLVARREDIHPRFGDPIVYYGWSP